MKLPPSHHDSPRHTDWLARVIQLESEGLDRSDAQGIADMEEEQVNNNNKKQYKKINMNKENAVLELVKLLSEAIDVLNDYDREQCADYLSKQMQAILDSIKQ
jgi:hypothetical protein